MERIALIADIHGNAVALGHVLGEIDRMEVDRIICLGDVAATGPQPREAIAGLRERNIPTIMGNADAEILDPPDPGKAEEPMRRFLEMSVWGNEQLSPEDRSFLSGFPASIEIEVDDGELLCVHGSPQSFDDAIRADTGAAELDRMLNGHDAGFVTAGHTHIQMMRRHRHQILINPGAVGLAYDPVPPAEDVQAVPWAEFAVVEFDESRFECCFQRVPYDVEPLLAAARESGMPHAEWWASHWRRT